MRRPVSILAAAVVVAGPTALASFSGGFFDKPRLVAAIGAAALLGIGAVVEPHPLPRSTPGRLALGGLAALTAWTALSYSWAPLGDRAQADLERLVLYLFYFAAAIALLRRAPVRRWLEPATAAGTLVVVGYGLSARVLPSLLQFQQSRSAEGRLEQPLTYWNGMGCLAAIGLVLLLRVAADHRHPSWTRLAAAAAAPSLGLGLYLSFSRGALFALAAGVALLLLTAPLAKAQALTAAALLVPGAAASAVAAAALPRVEALSVGQTGDAGQGAVMLVVLAVLSVLTAVVASRLPLETGTEPPRRIAGLRGRWVATALVVLAAASVAGVAALGSGGQAKTAGNATSATRFGSTDSVRYAFWDVALREFRDHPVEGVGAGGFAVDWRAEPDRAEPAVDAHSLYVETLGELGLVGAACLALFLTGVGLCGAGLYRRAPAAACGLMAGMLVWAVHSGLDWDWEIPALTGIALLLAAAAVAWNDRPDPA